MTNSGPLITHESWFSRITSAIKGILIGIVLVLVAFPVLFWNEGRAVRRDKDLHQGASSVVTVAADRVDPINAGKLVYLTADAKAAEALADPAFALSVPALRLGRSVEMYQWQEKKDSKTDKNLGGGSTTTTRYTYTKGWQADRVDSSKFNEAAAHTNPTPAFTSATFAAPITVGAFTLPSDLVNKIPLSEPVALSDQSLAALPEILRKTASLDKNAFYVGADPANPAVGDLRISFRIARPGPVSLVAQQSGNSFQPFVAASGSTISLLQTGTHPSAELFQQAQAENSRLTWILRFVGLALFFFGFSLILKPLAILADVIPFLGSLVGAGAAMVALALSLLCGSLTIALGWLFYRPLLALPLLLLAAISVVLLIRFLRRPKPV